MMIPKSAADAKPTDVKQSSPCAYIPNPIKDKALLTPDEVVDVISKLSAMLTADNRYRASLQARGIPK